MKPVSHLRCLATALLLLTAAGCGQKGPLFLPEKPAPAAPQATPAAAATPTK